MTIREKYSGMPIISGFGLNAFSREELDTIHHSALHILEKVGLKVESDEAIELFQGAGAGVEKKDGIFYIKLQPNLVEGCLQKTPKNVTYFGRDEKFDYAAKPGRIGFSAFGQCVNILDPITGEPRLAGKADNARSARLQDALGNLRTATRTVVAADQQPSAQALHCMDAMIRNSGKHISCGAGNRQNLEMIIQLLEVAGGGRERFQRRPFYSPSFCPTSPLALGKECCEVAIGAAKAGLPVVVMIMPLGGGTAPVTLAGTIALGIAEQLSGLTLVQLVRPKTPVTFGSATTIMDLKSGIGAMGAPEAGMINSSLAQMALFYKLPSRVACGVSDAKVLDAQIGYEYATNALTAALAGASLVFGGGALESGLTHSPAKLILDHECMGYIQNIVAGVPVDEEKLALDVIEEIGPGQSYLMHEHTFANMRSQSRAEIFDRRTRDAWFDLVSGKTAAEMAAEKAIEIMEHHHPPPLPRGAEEIMDEMIAEFEAKLETDRRR